MGAAIALRGDFDGPGLRRLAKATKDAGQSRRRLVHIPMIATGYSDRSRPPIPTHRDHFCGRGCVAV